MLPADGNGAPPASGQEAPAPPDASPATRRLALALERIAEALVRRAEAAAAARDRFEHELHVRAPCGPEGGLDGTLDNDTVEELRHRVDAAILLVRATLGEA